MLRHGLPIRQAVLLFHPGSASFVQYNFFLPGFQRKISSHFHFHTFLIPFALQQLPNLPLQNSHVQNVLQHQIPYRKGNLPDDFLSLHIHVQRQSGILHRIFLSLDPYDLFCTLGFLLCTPLQLHYLTCLCPPFYFLLVEQYSPNGVSFNKG